MDDTPLLQNTEKEAPVQPFICPFCPEPVRVVNMTGMGVMIVFWCQNCKKILGCQALAIPRGMMSPIALPGQPKMPTM